MNRTLDCLVYKNCESRVQESSCFLSLVRVNVSCPCVEILRVSFTLEVTAKMNGVDILHSFYALYTKREGDIVLNGHLPYTLSISVEL